MKKLIIFIFLAITGLNVQVTGDEHLYTMVSDYACPVCRTSSPSPGRCETHNAELIQEGMYYCRTDLNIISTSPGKCSRCGNPLLRMEMARPDAGYALAMVQDTTKRTEQHTGKAVRDAELEEQMNNDPDNRDRSKPKTVPELDSANVPE